MSLADHSEFAADDPGRGCEYCRGRDYENDQDDPAGCYRILGWGIAVILLFVLVALLCLMTACTSTRLESFPEGGYVLDQKSLLQPRKFAGVELSADGSARMIGYENKGGEKAAGEITSGAVRGIRGF